MTGSAQGIVLRFTQREEVAARWQKCKYHTNSSSEQSSEGIDLCTDSKQKILSVDSEFADFSNTSPRKPVRFSFGLIRKL